jgi:quercetin dioxygenase-like cupin family protein
MGTIHKFQGTKGPYRWEGVPVTPVEEGASPGVTRQIIVGAGDKSKNFIIRYFELPPGGSSPLHTHWYEHGVVVVRGRGHVRFSDHEQDIFFGDAVFVEPNELHQFSNNSDEPFGFTCTIPAS